MANNPYVNKVVYGNSTVMDISDTTAEESDVASGKTFYKASGAKGVGTAVTPDISNCYQSTDSQETDIQDADYFPFYDSSATAKRNTLWSNIKAKLKNYFDTLYATYLGVSGLIETTVGWSTKNILNCDIASGTQTINGLTVNVSRTTGGDLIYVKVSGTATANTNIQVASSVSDDEYNELTGGKYILNGCPSGGSSSTYSLLISGGYGGYTDTGSGVLISSTVTNAKVYIVIKNGYTANNLQFKPMIRSRYVDDDTYEAFSPNVKDSKFDRAEQRVLGVKNLGDLKLGYALAGNDQTGYVVNQSAAGSITLIAKIDKGQSYRITKNSSKGNRFRIIAFNNYPIGGYDTTSVQIVGDSSLNSYEYTNSSFNYLAFTCNYDDTSVTPSDVQGMIRLASDPDDTYVPYAMTNRELTELATVKESAVTNIISGARVGDAGNHLIKVGKVVTLTMRLNSVTITAWDDDMCLIPQDYRPKYNLRTSNMFANSVQALQINSSGSVKSTLDLSNATVYIHTTWITD